MLTEILPARCCCLELDELRPINTRLGPIEAASACLSTRGPGKAPVRSRALRRHGAWH
jgi:hypothetical protein